MYARIETRAQTENQIKLERTQSRSSSFILNDPIPSGKCRAHSVQTKKNKLKGKGRSALSQEIFFFFLKTYDLRSFSYWLYEFKVHFKFEEISEVKK